MKLFVAGDAIQGESIILLICGDGGIIYSAVIDSFKKNDLNIPKKILNDLNIEALNALYWTHPHDDHSIGLDELVDEFRPTEIFIPDRFDSVKKCHGVSLDICEKIESYRARNRVCKKYIPIVNDAETNYLAYENQFIVKGIRVPVSIYCIAPHSMRITDKIKHGTIAPNDFSISFMLNVGDFSVLLTGDIENSMIDWIQDKIRRPVFVPNILKIPHHGSLGSCHITNLYGNALVDLGIVTAKSASHLPRPEGVDYYNSRCERLLRIDSSDNDFALWGTEIDILNRTVKTLINKNYTGDSNNGE